MDLLLWRHAEAEEGANDLKRSLTRRGEKQARQVAHWMHENMPKQLRILVSPAVRCQQTAAALDLPFETHRQLSPENSAADLIAACGWPDASGAVLIIGHQPALGQMAALLLAGAEANWTLKKGALWWFTNRVRAGETQTVLRSVITPEFCK